MRQLIAELVGTFFLVFAGTGAIIINDVTGGTITHLGIALTFGLIVLAMIALVGDISGAHLNPAVTIGFVVAGQFPLRRIPGYLLAQISGALLASAVLRFLFPDHPTLGATLPRGAMEQSFVLELILTLMLMMVVLAVATGSREKGWLAGVTIGSVIALEATFAGPICGASMNPARSLGPALVALRFDSLGIYLTAPILGAILAVPLSRYLRTPDLSEVKS